MFVNDMLDGESLVVGAMPWAVACLGGGAQIVLLSEVLQALNQNTGVKPADRLSNSYGSVSGSICCIAFFVYWRD